MSGLYKAVWPLLRCLDPETAHGLAIFALKHGLVSEASRFDDARLRQTLWGRDFVNPVGLAAGFDKNAEVSTAMLGQGFGFVEAGTVTPKPQSGNPKPRLFRLTGDGAVINRLGFNGAGQDVVRRNLEGIQKRRGPIGINLGKNAATEDSTADYVSGIRSLASLADYLVINVSSPNTPGLRALQSRDQLSGLLDAIRAELRAVAPKGPPPLLLKVAPDLTEDDKRDIAEVALEHKLDGVIATNTTLARLPGLNDPNRDEKGGLSGRPLFDPSTQVLADFYRLTEGRLALIGVGGITSGADAYAKIRAGASLVQLYTALVFEGPGLVNRINRELAERLAGDGFNHISDAIGADHR